MSSADQLFRANSNFPPIYDWYGNRGFVGMSPVTECKALGGRGSVWEEGHELMKLSAPSDIFSIVRFVTCNQVEVKHDN